MAARGHVQHGAFADPERAAGAGRHHLVHGRVAQRGHRDAARPGLQRAVQRDLADAGQIDALSRVDRHQRTFRQRQADAGQLVLRGLQRAALQGQAGALALRQHALDRVFLVERRRPGLQGPRLVRRGGGVRRQAQQRHRDAQLRAFDDFQAARADQFVLREALREVAVRQHRQAGGRGLAALLGAHHADLVGLQGQLAAAVHAARGQRAVQRQHAGRPRRSGLQQQIAAPAGQGLAAALDGGPAAHVHQAALAERDAAAAAQRHLSAVAARQAGRGGGIERGIGPQAADIERGARRQRDAGGLAGRGPDEDVLDHATVIDLPEHVAGLDAAALRGDAGLDIDLRRVQQHAGAGGEPQRLFDGDPFLGGHGQLTRIDRVQPGGVQAYLAVGGRTAADGYLAGQRGQGPSSPGRCRRRSAAGSCRRSGGRGAPRSSATADSRPCPIAARRSGAGPGRPRR